MYCTQGWHLAEFDPDSPVGNGESTQGGDRSGLKSAQLRAGSDHRDRYDLVIREIDKAEAPLGNGVALDNEGPLIPVISEKTRGGILNGLLHDLAECVVS